VPNEIFDVLDFYCLEREAERQWLSAIAKRRSGGGTPLARQSQ